MKLVLERFAHNALALLAVTTILFFMFRLMPGTPLAAYISENLNADQQQQILEQFGLDKPMWQQYLIYLGNLARGELGLSFFQRRPVLAILLEVLPNSLILTLTSLIIAYIVGVLAGAWLAWRRGSWVEGVAIPVVLATRAAPEFWIGMVLLAVLSFKFGWFPSGGASSPGMVYAGEWQRMFSLDYLHHLALPVFTLALYLQGLPLLLMRSNMLEVMHVIQCRRADATHRERALACEDVLEIHPFDAEQRGVRDGDLVGLNSRTGEISLHAKITERVQPGIVYTTFHHAETGANVVTTDYSDWATNCPEYKVTAVQVRRTNHFSDWQVRDREEGVSLRRTEKALADAAE